MEEGNGSGGTESERQEQEQELPSTGGDGGDEEESQEGGAPSESVVVAEIEESALIEAHESSIIEMEIDDSNTGDTITSNPEIDSGSAAAAATAVIIDDKPDDIVSVKDDVITLEAEGEGEVEEDDDIQVIRIVGQDPAADADENFVEDIENEPDGDVPTITSVFSTQVPLQIQSNSNQPEDGDGERNRADVSVEEMDVSEIPFESGDTVVEPAIIESGGDLSGTDVEQDVNEPMEPESDSALEIEHEEEQFLHEEESNASAPDDTTETDKENNGGDGLEGDILVCDDENEDGDDDILEITRRRISQDREGNCYCGKDRNFNIAELLCASCYRWFHESCISYQLGKLVPFSTNYVFMCKNCSPSGLESFKRSQGQFNQMCTTALANLTQASVKEGTNIKHFSKDNDIIPFFEIHWEALTTTTRRSTQSWHATVSKTLLKDAGIVYSCQEIPGDDNSPYFGLLSEDLSIIRPNYEAMIKGGHLKVTDQRNCSSALRGRGAKRRTVADQSTAVQNTLNKKPRSDMYGPKPVIGHGYPTEHPFNKDSYRYILAEPDPNAPFRQEFDESNEWSGKPIHGWLCRIVNPSSVLLALHDRAPQLKVSEDRLSVTGDKGYCMIRATHGVTRGSWYFEAKITDMPEGSATRIGFSQQFGNLQGPLGFDRYGYSWRSRYGTTFHEARGKSYAKGGYGLDDVLGFLIVLPDDKQVPSVSTSFKDRPLVKVKSHLYYEDKDDPKELEKRELRKGAKIICFKNGVCQGVAFEDIYCGTYYPAISLYKSITVRLNFGPDFWAPPSADYDYRGMGERAESSIIEQTMADLLYLTENDGRLKLDNAVPMPL